MNRIWICFAVFVAAPALVAGCSEGEVDTYGLQGSVEGQVTLEDSNNHSGVEVTAGSQSTTTDRDGHYRLDWLSIGTVEVTADHPDYTAETHSADIALEEVTNRDFELDLADSVAAISAVEGVPSEMIPGQSAELSLEVDNPDHVDLEVDWEATNGFEAIDSGFREATLTAPDNFDIDGMLTATIEDPRGLTDSETIQVQTRTNAAPEIVVLTAQPPQVEPGGQIEVSVEATDPDGDGLDIHWSAPPNWQMTTEDSTSATVTAPDEYDTSGHVGVEVVDDFGATTTAEHLVSTVTNQGPKLESISADPMLADRGETIELEATASHPEDAPLDYHWSAPDEWQLVEDSQDPSRAQLTAPEEPTVATNVDLTVTDPLGQSADGSLPVSTVGNNPPIIDSLEATPSSVEPGGTIDIDASATDPDGEQLTFDWDVSTDGDWEETTSGDSMTLQAPDDYGQSASIELTVDDGWDTTSDTVAVSTVSHVDPVITNFSADPYVVDRTDVSHLSVEAHDPYDEPLSYSWNDDEIDGGWSLDADDDEATLQSPDLPDDSVVVTVSVDDGLGGTAESSLTVATAQNTPPTIEAFEFGGETTSSADLAPGDSATIQAVVDTYEDDPSLSYDWSITSQAAWSLDGTGQSPYDEVLVHAPDEDETTAVLTLEVTDEWGDTDTATFELQT